MSLRKTMRQANSESKRDVWDETNLLKFVNLI